MKYLMDTDEFDIIIVDDMRYIDKHMPETITVEIRNFIDYHMVSGYMFLIKDKKTGDENVITCSPRSSIRSSSYFKQLNNSHLNLDAMKSLIVPLNPIYNFVTGAHCSVDNLFDVVILDSFDLKYNEYIDKYDCLNSIGIFQDVFITEGKLNIQFGNIRDRFFMLSDHLITSLEGCPNYVGGKFELSLCHSIKSLFGGPSYVGGDFDIWGCYGLQSLDGMPQKVGGNFMCSQCKSLILPINITTEVGGITSLCYNGSECK